MYDHIRRRRMKYKNFNRLMTFALYAIMVTVLGACATAQKKEITLNQSSTATGVFQQIQNGEAAKEGSVDLLIKVSIKTPVSGYHLFESKDHLHGKPGYPFLFNIDGQAVVWKADKITEDLPGSGGSLQQGPDTGPGVKYVIEKTIRLLPGSHRVFFALPEENYFTQKIIDVKKEGANVLEYRPIYRKPSRGITENFENGVSMYEVYSNGSPIGP
jgi:hypothetical protein